MTTRALAYRVAGDLSVGLHANDEPDPVRVAVRPAGSKRTADKLAGMLNAALREGAAYGPGDQAQELADALERRVTPGLVRYELTPSWTVVRHVDGAASTLQVPALRAKGALVELARELAAAFELGGQFPGAVPAAGGGPVGVDPGAALQAKLATLSPGQVLLEVVRGSVVHWAVETPDQGILCACGKAGRSRFAVARQHTRTRTMPVVRELGTRSGASDA